MQSIGNEYFYTDYIFLLLHTSIPNFEGEGRIDIRIDLTSGSFSFISWKQARKSSSLLRKFSIVFMPFDKQQLVFSPLIIRIIIIQNRVTVAEMICRFY